MGAVVAAFVYVGVIGLAAAAIVGVTYGESEAPGATPVEVPSGGPSASASAAIEKTSAQETDTEHTDATPAAADPDSGVDPRARFVWTTETPATIEELARAWSIPREVLADLNPDLAAGATIEAGTKVVVHSPEYPGSISVGSPNDGRLQRGVPLPEGRAWLMPVDRTRAFATVETINAVVAGLEAYGAKFPDAEPIQIGDLSARRGGKIYGHQSHQTGRDVDIRLVHDASGEGFDPERNWFLVKTLVDGSEVTAIFLNAREQTWLRVAADADVGEEAAGRYFALIHHEPGHTIHMHVRFACPDASYRCVAYPVPDRGEQAPKSASKLPSLPSKTTRKESKLPVLPSKPDRLPSKDKDKAKDTDKPKKKAGKKGKRGKLPL